MKSIFKDLVSNQDLQDQIAGHNGFRPGHRLMGVLLHRQALVLDCLAFSNSSLKYFYLPRGEVVLC